MKFITFFASKLEHFGNDIHFCQYIQHTVTLRNGGSANKGLILCNFSHKLSSNLSISLVQNISVLDKSRRLFSCVRVDYENKAQMFFNPSIQFFIDARGVIIDREEGMHYAKLKFTRVLNRTLFSYAN